MTNCLIFRTKFITFCFDVQGTNIATNSYFFHHDHSVWNNPDEFCPERYLDQNGKYQAKFGRTFVFGSGK